ncbi:MAG TPA: AAA family ATPase, partial [Pyrinomonadaceae bacterium]|nr:AAA family ATPase [Pyrinomonadaceae bacterium]
MTDETRISFDAFSLDRANECLWRGSRAIKLRPKAFAVLNHLIVRSGQLVTKEELLNTVWSETFVGDAVLKVTIRQLRKALNDNSSSPRFIETAHRRGYRFIGQIGETGRMRVRDQESTDVGLPQTSGYDGAGVVGRDDALSLLQRSLGKMRDGERQIVFVTGEAGIGKTALVDAFAHSFNGDGNVRVARGQCLEQYGTGEAYLPVLEAIGRLCREHDQVLDVLRAHAPMWLLQLPSVVSRSERESLSREISGATRERMLREMGDALEAITADSPLVLILEDLHWSDYSTLDLISYLANQRQRARLMLIGTYRPVELIVSGHPLKAVKQELLAKQQCDELPLNYLSEEAVGTYLKLRFAENHFPPALGSLIHNRTEGNPLFMVNAVDYLLAEKSIVEREHVWELVMANGNVELG